MIYKAIIKGKKIWFDNNKLVEWDLQSWEGKEVCVEITKFSKTRTTQQNRALHLWFTQLAEALNEAGLWITKVLSVAVEHPWNDKLIKELMWRKVQKSMYGKKSTRELSTTEIDQVYDVITKYLGEEFGFTAPAFPNIELLMNQEYGENEMF